MIGESGRTSRGQTFASASGGVENVPVASPRSVAPEIACSPALIVTLTSVAFGNRASLETNAATRVSIHFHVPAIGGVIVAGGVA